MYFASRVQAGRMLSAKLVEKYAGKKCAVVALGDGGVMVGAQIAKELHCVITLLMSAEIMLPREPQAIAGITSGGVVAFNHGYSDGELDEMVGEYYSIIEREKLLRMHDLNQLLGGGGTISKELLKDHHVIIVSDGLKTGFEVDLAAQFLKSIAVEGMIVVTPFASVQAVDRMHVLADDLYCLNVISEYIDTDHYYDTQDVPDHETVIKTIQHITTNWQDS
jgi:putative phosphoribosyl transferase